MDLQAMAIAQASYDTRVRALEQRVTALEHLVHPVVEHVPDVDIPTVLLDAGHGGSDPGASGNGLVEKNITLEIALATAAKLRTVGYRVLLTRIADITVPLVERGVKAPPADFYVAIHCNAFTNPQANGTEVWYWTGNAESKAFANRINQETLQQFPTLTNRGVKEGKGNTYWYCFNANIPKCVLFETAFISNAEDATLLTQYDRWATTICNAIIA